MLEDNENDDTRNAPNSQVGDFLTEESRALAWWQNASDTTIRDFNIAVLELEQSTDLKHLHDTFIKPPPVNCRAQVASQVQQVMFGQVSSINSMLHCIYKCGN